MKRLIAATTLALLSIVYATVVSRDVLYLFPNLASYDQTNKYYYVQTSGSTADSITSTPIVYKQGTGAVAVDLSVSSISGTMSFKLEFGIYVGAGIGEGGYKWYTLEAISAAGDYSYDVSAQSFGSRPYSKFALRILESGVQSNKYILWVHYEEVY